MSRPPAGGPGSHFRVNFSQFQVQLCWGLTHISCRGWFISILSLFTAGSAGPLDTSASPSSSIFSVQGASDGTGKQTGGIRLKVQHTLISLAGLV